MATTLPVIAGMMVAYGTVLHLEGTSERGAAGLALLASLASCAVLAILTDPAGMGLGLVACLVAAAMARIVRSGRLDTGSVCAVVALATLAGLGADALRCYLSGTTLGAAVAGQVEAVQDQLLGSSDIEVRATALSTGEALSLYWPMAYAIQAAAMALFSHWGCLEGLRRAGMPARRRGSLERFDAPLWVALAYVAGAAASITGLRVQGVPQELRLVGENTFTFARCLLWAQGTGVALCLLRRHHAGPLTRALSVCLSVWLESSYVIMSVVGLVDVLANFRGIERGRRLGRRGPAAEGKRSATADQQSASADQ